MRSDLLATSALVVLTLAAAAPAQAQNPSRESDDDVIVVTSAPLGVSADEVAGAVEVVDRRHIEDNLSGSLADTISHEPGVSTSYFGPAASRPVIRGLGSDRVRVLVNGVGLIDASTNSPDHAVASEALEAESVEILRGPSAIAYGGGAIGGVVNVIDGRIPEERAEDGLEGRFYAGMTSVDEGETAAGRVRFNAGEFVFQFDGMTRHTEDYDIPGAAESEIFHLTEEAEAAALGDAAGDGHEEEEVYGTVENSALQFDTASGGVSWVGERGFIGASIKRTEALYGVPGGHAHGAEEPAGEEEGPVRIDMEQTRYDLRGELRDIGGHLERVRFSFGVGDYQHTELEGDAIGTQFFNEGWEGRVDARHVPIEMWGGSLDGAAGVQAFSRDFEAIGDEAFVPASTTEDWGLFLVERWDRESWGLEGGLRLETRDLDTATASRSFDTQSLSGSIFFRPVRDTFLALTLSSSERAPTDVELFADGPHVATGSYERGDPSLDIEQALSAEITARTSFGDWAFEGSVFRAEYDGFIGTFPTDEEIDGLPVFEFRQQDVTLSGLESRLEGPVGSLGGWDVDGEITAEYVTSDIDGGGNLPLLPPLSLTGGLTAQSGMHEVHAELVWADVQDETAQFELKTGSYVLLNARWSIEPFQDRGLRVILEGRNLTDEDARLHTSVLKDTVPLPGRNFRAALVLDF